MRLILPLVCLIASFAITPALRGVQVTSPSSQSIGQATYPHVPAYLEALTCSDPEQQSDCKTYFAGFAQTIGLILMTDPSTKVSGMGVCGDITDLVHEFIQEVRNNPKAQKEDTHAFLFGILVRDHNCAKIKEPIQNQLSAGHLIDMCHAGDIGFSVCSQYQAGFLGALLFVSEQTGTPILCGDQRLISPLTVAQVLNERLEADYHLRRDPAVTVMLNEMKAKMPCVRR